MLELLVCTLEFHGPLGDEFLQVLAVAVQFLLRHLALRDLPDDDHQMQFPERHDAGLEVSDRPGYRAAELKGGCRAVRPDSLLQCS